MTAAHLINLSPSTAIEFKTFELVWTDKFPNYSRLKVFGCAAYAHQTEGKLEPKSVKCVFLGYPDGVKGYRLWLKENNGYKVIISRDVIFNENNMPCRDGTFAGTDSQEIQKLKHNIQLEVEPSNDENNDYVAGHEPQHFPEPQQEHSTPFQYDEEAKYNSEQP